MVSVVGRAPLEPPLDDELPPELPPEEPPLDDELLLLLPDEQRASKLAARASWLQVLPSRHVSNASVGEPPQSWSHWGPAMSGGA